MSFIFSWARPWLLLIVLAFSGLSLHAATYHYMPTWDWTTFSNKYASLTSGDIVILAPGTNTWNGQGMTFSSKKSFWLHGCGTNQTRLYLTNVGTGFNFTDADTNNPTILFSDLYIDNAATVVAFNAGYNPPSKFVAGAPPRFPADIGIFRCVFNLRNRTSISVGGGGGLGYISENRFLKQSGTLPSGNHIVTLGNEYTSWAEADPTGTTNMWFIDGNEFDSEKIVSNWYPSNGHIDGYQGASAAYRRNVLHGAPPTGSHGYDSDPVGMRYALWVENTFTNMDGANHPTLIRSGVLDVVGNNVYGSGSTNIASFGLQYYRQAVGSYQRGRADQAFDKTNYYTGTVLSAGNNSITVTNEPGGVQYRFNQQGTAVDGWPGFHLMITGGTGAGQRRIVASTTIWSSQFGQIDPGTATFTVSTNWTINPDATSTFQLCPWPGVSWQIGNQDNYTFTTNTPATTSRQVKVALLPDGTPDAETTFQNLQKAVNGTGTSGVEYFYSAVRISQGRAINWDINIASANSNTVVWHNILDGPGDLGYPGAFQPGVMTQLFATNVGTITRPCRAISNFFNGTTPLGFVRIYEDDGSWVWYNTNSVVIGRDSTNMTSWPDAEVTYPYRPFVPNDVTLTVASIGASPTITTTEDLAAGSGAGSRIYHVGQQISLTAPATVGSAVFGGWRRDGSDYSSTNFTYTVDQARTFEAVYILTVNQLSGSAVLRGHATFE
jgi:hypothetical protein